MSTASDEAAEQVAANRSALPHRAAFQGHRDRLTTHLCNASHGSAGQTLCVLGAGNAYDLDLARLAAHFTEIHLVDLDADAVRAVCEREANGARLVAHAPIELSGMHARLERWARMQLTPEELIGHASVTARSILDSLGQRFDVVLSACMLSQMQLSLLRGLGERHRLFEALRMTLNLTHLRTLVELSTPGGRALFVTDVSSDAIRSFGEVEAGNAALGLVRELSRSGEVFAFAEPERLRQLFHEDPWLSSHATISELDDAWIWQNVSRRFLVYALQLTRSS